MSREVKERKEDVVSRLETALPELFERHPRHKPKLPARKKLARLVAQQQFKDAILPASVHYIRRYLAWRAHPQEIRPADDLEQSMFDLLEKLPEQDRSITTATYEWILARYEGLSQTTRRNLFDEAFLNLPLYEAVTKAKLKDALAKELVYAGIQYKLNGWGGLPGKVRQKSRLVYDSSDPDGGTVAKAVPDAPEIKMWEINGLRGAALEPAIPESSYTEEEVEQECTYTTAPAKTGDPLIQATCTKKLYNPTDPWEGEHVGNICLRVPEFSIEELVTVIGSNFFDAGTVVRITHSVDTKYTATFKCNVFGDQMTPVYDTAGSLINDTRARDRLTFSVDKDTWESKQMPPGIYNLQIGVPNSINWKDGGSAPPMFWSFTRPVRVRAVKGEYKLSIEQLDCIQETQPFDTVASDEVGVIVYGVQLDDRGQLRTFEAVDDMFSNSGLEDVDTGQIVPMKLWLLGTDTRSGVANYQEVAPGTNIALSLTGYEIDSEDAYKDQIRQSWAVFQKMWSSDMFISEGLSGAVGLVSLLGWISSATSGLIGAIITAIKFIVTLILSWWAPPDLIMKDLIPLSATALDFRTRPKTQLPMDSKYDVDKIHVHVIPKSKKVVPASGSEPAYVEYTEQRIYKEDDSENSTYSLLFKYRRAM